MRRWGRPIHRTHPSSVDWNPIHRVKRYITVGNAAISNLLAVIIVLFAKDAYIRWIIIVCGLLTVSVHSITKFFLLFLFYTFLETTLVTLSLLPNFLGFFTDQEINISPAALATTFMAFVLNLAFALSISGFLIMNISLVAENTTTIEAYEKRSSPKRCYDLGRMKNFEQVFGTDTVYMFLPAYTDEDKQRIPWLQGLEYPLRPNFNSEVS